MLKSIFVSADNIDGIQNTGANHLIVSGDGLNRENWHNLDLLGLDVGISLIAFEKGACPADPAAVKALLEKIEWVMQFSPGEVWLDYFRFGGDCSVLVDGKIPNVLAECPFCRGQDRVEVINRLLRQIRHNLGLNTKLGLFTVAVRDTEVENFGQLGLDYHQLGSLVDLTSPMLYQRMMGKSVEYIHPYIEWMAAVTGKPVMPIIQIKDMPDDLPDLMTEQDIRGVYAEAVKAPSVGVCIFCWNHVIEKYKQTMVEKILSE